MKRNIFLLIFCVLYFNTGRVFAQGRSAILTWPAITARTNNITMSSAETAALKYTYYVGTKSCVGVPNCTYSISQDVLSPTVTANGRLSITIDLPFAADINLYFAMDAYFPPGSAGNETGSSNLRSAKSVEVMQAGKIKLAPPGVPEIISQLGPDEYEHYEYAVFNIDGAPFSEDSHGEYVIPAAIKSNLATRHPGLLSGALTATYIPAPTHSEKN